MKEIGFTGTQKGMSNGQKITLCKLLELLQPTRFHHGDCIGADAQAHHAATFMGVKEIIIHPPTNPSKRAFCECGTFRTEAPYLERNQHIVNESDALIATPHEFTEQVRSGTWSTVRKARTKGIPIFIVWPCGVVTEENTNIWAVGCHGN